MKNLCKLSSKEFKENYKDICKLVKKPKYICLRCARVSNDKNVLCRPEKI